jgi:hypothetical protein
VWAAKTLQNARLLSSEPWKTGGQTERSPIFRRMEILPSRLSLFRVSYKSKAPRPAKNARNGAPSLFGGILHEWGRGPPVVLTVDLVGALSDFDDIAVWIADVAAYLAVLGYWWRDELGSSTFP